mgnify:CR=1 FL=1
MQLHWHRRNLRPHPNPALATALSAAEERDSGVVSLFVLDDSILAHADGLRVAFMLGGLHTLREWYRDHGSDLLIRHGDPADLVGSTAEAVGAERVVWNSDHSQLARGRDSAVERALARAGIDHTAVPSEESAQAESAASPASAPITGLADPNALDIENRAVPHLTELVADAFDTAPLTAGTESARKRLRAMSNGRTYRRCDDASR